MTKKEQEALLKVYRDNGFEVQKDLKTNQDRDEELTSLANTYGLPHIVTEEDLELNPDNKVGDVIFVKAPIEEEDQEDIIKVDEEPVVEDKEEHLYYLGKPIVRVDTRIISSKIYKEVYVSEASYLLSMEEYAEKVTKE